MKHSLTLTEEEMIKIYACLAFCYNDMSKGLDSNLLAIKEILEPNREDPVELEKLAMKFYCEIKNEKILDEIDDAIDGVKEDEDDQILEENFEMIWFKLLRKPYNIFYCGLNKFNEHCYSVGCECHPIQKWNDEKFVNNLISKHNLSKELSEEYLKHLSEINLHTQSLRDSKLEQD